MAKALFIPVFLAIFSGLLSTSPLVAAASTVNLEKRYTNLGCYTDSAPRVLHYGMPTPSSPMTPEVCIGYCTSSGFALAGVEYGSECYCGNGFLYDYGQSQSCNMPCQGDAQQTCGGPNAIRIFATGVRAYTRGPASAPTLYNGWLRTQCWQDDMWQYGGNRILRRWPATPIPPEQMTIGACINGCGAAGYTSAGVEWGQGGPRPCHDRALTGWPNLPQF
ncbi:WSC domain-containing protein [Panaeolus papilionaceus]|nr:WSC domain-containing protein [Panaeolus papilionaceus]